MRGPIICPVSTSSADANGSGEKTAAQVLDVPDYRSAVAAALKLLRESQPGAEDSGFAVRAVGHRLIHGGEEIREPVRIDAAMKKTIARFTHLAPLHIPPGLEAIEATEAALRETAHG